MHDTQQGQRGVPRRSVTRGAAWAAPVLVAAGAAPALAASIHPDVSVTGSEGCRTATSEPNTFDFYVKSCVVNNDSHVVIVNAPSQMRVGTALVSATPNPARLTLAPGQSGCLVVHGVYATSRSVSLTAIFTLTDQGSTPNPVGTATGHVPSGRVGADCSGIA